VVSFTQAVCLDVAVAERLAAVPDPLGMQPLHGGGWVQQVKARRSHTRALASAGESSPALGK
jgi:hypothetical protein